MTAEGGARLMGPSGVAGNVTVWYVEYDDFGVFYTGTYENLGRIVAQGVDLEVEWHLGDVWECLEGLSLGGSVTFQDSELRSGPNRGNETPYAWASKAAWRARYERAGWVLSAGGTYMGDSYSDDANTSVENPDGNLGVNPSRILWDARVAKRVALGEKGTLEIAVGATNVFDEEWHVHSRGGFFGGGLVAGPPRQLFASFEVTVNW
jgi:outer membrane receptor protein involved in Fe transport